jgi:hypothetical protein
MHPKKPNAATNSIVHAYLSFHYLSMNVLLPSRTIRVALQSKYLAPYQTVG